MDHYTVRLTRLVHETRKSIPAKVRNALVDLIDALASSPRPAASKMLDLVGQDHTEGWEVRRVRHTDWRIIYAVQEEWKEVLILAIRQRPPYSYDDLAELLRDID